MTREEAAAIIRKYDANGCGYCHQGGNEIEEDFDMAIKALEQEPCEDAISRHSTVEKLCKLAEFMNEKREGLGAPYVMAALFIQDNKDEFPSVLTQPKTGRWVYTGDYITEGMLKCSECGFEHDVSERFAYCPNCGAKMQEEEVKKHEKP